MEISNDMTVAQKLDAYFPARLEQDGDVTMQQLAGMRDALRAVLPPDASVEVSVLMNSILCTVFAPGEGRLTRTCTVVAAAQSLAARPAGKR